MKCALEIASDFFTEFGKKQRTQLWTLKQQLTLKKASTFLIFST